MRCWPACRRTSSLLDDSSSIQMRPAGIGHLELVDRNVSYKIYRCERKRDSIWNNSERNRSAHIE
jgi:hypothetical protein